TITWGVLLGLLILLGGLWWVQIISYRHYAENQKAQSFRTVRIPAIRGKILDRNGIPLAENRPSFNVNLYLGELREPFARQYRDLRPPGPLARERQNELARRARFLVFSNTVQRIANVLGESLPVDETQFQRHYEQRLALPLTLAGNLTLQQIARFQERTAGLPGLDLETQPERVYAHAPETAHLLGFLKRDDSSATDEDAFFNYRQPDYRGVVGIEGAFDAQLRGRAGVRSLMVNNLGYRQSDEMWSTPEPGRNVVLTIDLPLQTDAWRALKSHGVGTRGAVVVLDASNGDVLAMVSSPSYDANNFFPSPTPEEMARLNDEDLKPTMNRATQETKYYGPGSIFKIVTGMAALEHGLDPAELYRVAPHPKKAGQGVIFVGKRDIADLAGPGEFNFRRAFIKSSNAYFINCGLEAGMEAIRRIAERLHLGERTGLPLLQESAGKFPSREWILRERGGGWSPGDTANICIGQGDVSVTPIQMAVMTAAIANGGKVFWPRIVDRIVPQENFGDEGVQRFTAGRVRDELGVKPSTIEIVRDAMFADVEDDGTGTAARVPGMKIGGKTGTAQVQKGKDDHIVWFASFGQYRERTYSVVVMVETKGGSGGGTCAPIAKQIYQAIVKREQQSARAEQLVRTEP
ncbi:MAG TPA: penicillin-binding transpeptidase domain-containing protein, partial [Verrucomicrobiae bacterium]